MLCGFLFFLSMFSSFFLGRDYNSLSQKMSSKLSFCFNLLICVERLAAPTWALRHHRQHSKLGNVHCQHDCGFRVACIRYDLSTHRDSRNEDFRCCSHYRQHCCCSDDRCYGRKFRHPIAAAAAVAVQMSRSLGHGDC